MIEEVKTEKAGEVRSLTYAPEGTRKRDIAADRLYCVLDLPSASLLWCP